jgi:hypothetical protein
MRVIAKEFYVKNYVKCLGVIAIVTVIGLLAACGGEDPGKTIIVTGIPAEYLKASLGIDLTDVSDPENEFLVAKGVGKISASTVTFDLYIVKKDPGNQWYQSSDRWTGKGTFNVHLSINGGWMAYLDNTEIKNTVTTIPFNKFTIFSWFK